MNIMLNQNSFFGSIVILQSYYTDKSTNEIAAKNRIKSTIKRYIT
jgi:hypothetical protein